SGVTSKPNHGNASSNVAVGSNGVVDVNNNTQVRGSLQLGPSASVAGSPNVTGGTMTLGAPIQTPASPPWNPGANPGGVPQTYTVNSKTTPRTGTYWFTSLTITKDLSFSPPPPTP